MRAILFIILGAIGLATIVMLLEAFVPKVNAQEIKHASQGKQKYDPEKLFDYIIDPHIEATKKHAMEEYRQCPPLRPERFRRRIKMIWGIDINNYPENALIRFATDYKLSLKYQTIQGFAKRIDYAETSVPLPVPPPPAMYLPFRQYFLYQDRISLKQLEQYWNGIDQPDYESPPNLLRDIYETTVFDIPKSLIQYIDFLPCEQTYGREGVGLVLLPNIKTDYTIHRTSDMRNDILTLYIMGELKKGRQLANNDSERDKKKYIALDIYGVPGMIGSADYPNQRAKDGSTEACSIFSFSDIVERGDISEVTPWSNYGGKNMGRGTASALSFLLQLKGKSFDKFVLLFMSKQIKYIEDYNMDKTIQGIKSNNYFGYTLLREFDNNLMREMPTLAKIGTSFQGHVKQGNTLLLLEPFKDSYDIDTLQTYETFTAYEMGHDDYYFVEVEKPVESPIAGTDGYAKIVDRTEIVHGYIEKAKVVPYTDAQLLAHPKFTDHTTSKRGVINDKDGYVNMRAERSTKAEVVDKIVTLGEFEYWQLTGNWCIVEKYNGKRGFVYKDRIKEKL